MSTPDLDRSRLLAAQRLAEARADLEALQAELTRVPRWRPSRGLAAQCEEALTLIDRMRDRMRQKLVVALIGPTGAGKSTLLNALAGVDDLSPVGVNRPTTRQVVVFSRDREDATPLLERLGHEHVQVVSSPAAVALEHVILVDTPDINSHLMAEHRPLVEAVIGQADVLICVFNAENPKSKENADFLAPFVAAFPSRFVLVALNQCDRQDETELKEDIRPDFERYLAASWTRPPAAVYCLSARRHLRRPKWPEGARPRHDFDEYPVLAETVFGSLNRASVVLDARVERARHLVSAVRRSIRERASAKRDALDEVLGRVRKLRGEALTGAARSLGETGSGLGTGTEALFYQRLANVWWGPVGWLIGLWARLLIVGTGFLNMLRFGHPLRQLWGAVSAVTRFKETRDAIEGAQEGTGLDVAAMRYRLVYERGWPEAAEMLVDAEFDPGLRDPSAVVPEAAALDRTLATGWNEALNTELDAATARLSRMGLQLFLNLWVLVPLGAVAVESVVSFVQGETLSGDYFRHGLVTVLLMWLLSFVVFQMIARVAGGARLLKRAFAGLLGALERLPDAGGEDLVVAEIQGVKRLGQG
jgi:energy-coupling factor transporter ATP-binding protein EcfA2